MGECFSMRTLRKMKKWKKAKFDKGKFVVTISPNVDYAFVSTLIAIVDAMKNIDKKNDEEIYKATNEVIAKISLSVYVSNFPSHLTVWELWNICGKKGTIADVFIAKHKNKLGQMFGFCRFIKVLNSENLIISLNNVWIDKLRLHANLARFGRKVEVKPSYAQPINCPFKAATAPRVSHNNNDTSYASVTKNSSPMRATRASWKSILNTWVVFGFYSILNLRRELCSWTPTFTSDASDHDDASSIGMFDKQDERLFKENEVESVFEIKDDVELGFSPTREGQQASEFIHNISSGESFMQPCFSLLHRLEETIKVGMALGLNMEGCGKTLTYLIADKGGFVVNK
nr:RNA-directed DNA polymerase, eukaryota, reverse transcriptase zinc-binding domain protein [Tanacetum cinerariifolium]